MNKLIFNSIILVVVILLAAQITRAQGTITYLSSLSPTSTGSPFVGSNSWLAAGFGTGNNVGGYSLNSIQLGLTGASGDPSGFTVMLYTQGRVVAPLPGSSLGILDGSSNPTTGGNYTYTPTSNLTLSPDTAYFIVVTAATAVANGGYGWSESTYPPSSSGGWGADNAVLFSNNGTSGWSPTPYLGIAQFSIIATPIPEPGILTLFALGGLAFLRQRRKAKTL